MSTTSVSGLRVLLTGAAGGVGTATAAALQAAGAAVTGIDLVGGPGIIAADVSDPVGIAAAVREAAERMGGIDALVNNAGLGEPQDAGAPPDAAARRIMEVNFWGAWNATAAALPHLLRVRGQVVNVASMLARVDVPYASAYMASKRALDAWSAALRLEYGDRLAVTVLYPGFIATGIHARSRELGASLDGMARPERVEDAAAGMLRALTHRPRELRLTRRTELEHAIARHAPRVVERAIRARADRLRALRPAPGFLRQDQESRP